MSTRYAFAFAVIFSLVLACGGDEGTEPAPEPGPKAEKPVEPEEPQEKPTEPPAPAEEATKPNAAGEIVFEVGDLIKYNITRFEVAAGSKVKIILKHTGSLPKEAMGHNIVILKPGNDMMAFATAAITARETDFIPANLKGQILANSSLVGGGQTTTLEFTAPAAREMPDPRRSA